VDLLASVALTSILYTTRQLCTTSYVSMTDRDYLTPAEVADELRVTVVTVRRWITSGTLRASKAGPRRWMIRRSELEAFLSAQADQKAVAAPSEDPSFKKHLVVPDER
jgi:excisionase family DNA binding protein